MQAFCTSLGKKGRPSKYIDNSVSIFRKKQELFENNCSYNEEMNLINLAYQFNKINDKEREIAAFFESVYFKVTKNLGVKKIPTIAPNMWDYRLRSVFERIIDQDEKANEMWDNIRNYLNTYMQNESMDFIKLMTTHHSYEELMILKMNCDLMSILKTGLNCIRIMLESSIF